MTIGVRARINRSIGEYFSDTLVNGTRLENTWDAGTVTVNGKEWRYSETVAGTTTYDFTITLD